MNDADRAARVIAAEATRYLSAVETFAALGHDPHAAARTRARLAREREAARARPLYGRDSLAYARQLATMDRKREQARAARLAAREQAHDRATGPLRFAPCTVHGIEPCPDECPTYRQRLRAAGLEG